MPVLNRARNFGVYVQFTFLKLEVPRCCQNLIGDVVMEIKLSDKS